jgi:glycosyltransferase involved in cell wall biosynthesis
MREEPLVSIALCTYNGEKYIRQQLDSIINQTYQNLEIVIVDDSSSDDTYNIAGNYAQKDSRIKCFRNEVNLGFNKNFEKAIKLTTGAFIAISDQDDIWLPQKIESLLNHIGNNWLIFSNSAFINERNEIKDEKIVKVFNPAANNYKSILLANFVTGHTTLFKREFINYFLPFPEKGFYDWWMGFVALYHQKIIFFDEVLTNYRIHEASVMQNLINSGQEKQEANNAIAHMLSAFASYKNLTNEDKIFIVRLRNAYKEGLYQKRGIPLIRMILNNYKELFANQKIRKGLSLLNFARKYALKVKI